MKKLPFTRLATTLSLALVSTSMLSSSVEATEYTDYVVEKGDNLYRLALKYNTSVDAIASANNIQNKNLIRVNQALSIPTNTNSSSEDSSTATGSSANGKYTVQKGDTLSELALKFGTSVNQLASWNNISNIHFIREGWNLTISGGNSSSSSSGESSSTGGTTAENLNSSTTEDGVYYQIQKNDNLTKISKMFGVSVTDLAKWNNISNIHLIREGRFLLVNPNGSNEDASEENSQEETLGSHQYCVVKGDNLYRLAIRFGTSVEQLAQWNDIKNVRLIYIGDILQVAPQGENINSQSLSGTIEEFEPGFWDGVTALMPGESLPSLEESPEDTLETLPDESVEDSQNVIEEETSQDVTEEESSQDVTEEESSQDVTEEEDSQDVTEEEDSQDVTEEEDSQDSVEVEVQVELDSFTTDSPGILQNYDSNEADYQYTEPVEEDTEETVWEEEVYVPDVLPKNQYTVLEESTIFQIAAYFNASVADLLEWNEFENTNAIPAGTVLQIAP